MSDGSDPPGGSAEPREEEPHWRRLGFNSFEEFLAGLEANQARLNRLYWGRRSDDPPPASLPGDEIGDLGRVRRRRPVRQVGIKLRPADYEALAGAAFLYGVRPATMARMLVNRGARAVLESKRERLDRR